MTTRRGMVRAALGGVLGGLFARAQAKQAVPVHVASDTPNVFAAPTRDTWIEVTLKDGTRYSTQVWP